MKSYKYNQPYKHIARKSIYQQERDLLHEFLASDNNNIEFEYATNIEARNARGMLKLYVKNMRMPLEIKQRMNMVYAERKEVKKEDNV